MVSQTTKERTEFWSNAVELFKNELKTLNKPTFASTIMERVFKALQCDFNQDGTRQYPTSWPLIVRQQLGGIILGSQLVKLTAAQRKALQAALKKPIMRLAKAVVNKSPGKTRNVVAPSSARPPPTRRTVSRGRPRRMEIPGLTCRRVSASTSTASSTERWPTSFGSGRWLRRSISPGSSWTP